MKFKITRMHSLELLTLAAGALAGFLGALVGIGGGVLLVPLLNGVLGISLAGRREAWITSASSERPVRRRQRPLAAVWSTPAGSRPALPEHQRRVDRRRRCSPSIRSEKPTSWCSGCPWRWGPAVVVLVPPERAKNHPQGDGGS